MGMKSIWQGEEDYALDLGSQWIHGVNGNPIENVATTNGIPYMIAEELQMVYKKNSGGAIPEKEIDSLYQKLFDGNGGFFPYQEDLQCSTNKDQSIQSVADKYIKKKDMSPYEKGIFDYFLSSSIEHSYAASLNKISLWWWDMDWSYNGDDAYINQGHSELVTAHAKGAVHSIIDTSSVVTSINTKSKGIVKIQYTDTATDKNK